MFNQEKMIRFDVINGSYRNVNFVSIFFLALNRNPNIYIYNNHGMGRHKYSVCVFFIVCEWLFLEQKYCGKKEKKKTVDVILPIVFYCISLVSESWL